jgi:CheY-like chemotaxis protein
MKHILIIEDNPNTRKQFEDFFIAERWSVTTADNGSNGIELIKKDPFKFDCIILDWAMPVMNGEEVLAELKKSQLILPPIIVLSAYIDNYDIFNLCQEFNVNFLLKKPIDQNILIKIIENTINNNIVCLPSKTEKEGIMLFKGKNREYGYTNFMNKKLLSEKKIDQKELIISCKANEHKKLITSYFESQTKPNFTLKYKEPLFIIARRWNSWYPSFFDVPGGAYAIVGQKIKGLKKIAIIDPGFKFLSVTNSLGISVSEMESCVITHNHPDHLGGIFEFLSCRNVLNKTTKLFCSDSTIAMFGSWSNSALEIKPLNSSEQPLIEYETNQNKLQQISIKSFTTFHDEIGNIVNSCGLVIRSRQGNGNEILNSSYNQIVILGDTAYQTHDYLEKFIRENIDVNTKLLVLHIGCSQLRQQLGKHLYLNGLCQILEDINVTLKTINYNNKLLVLISEWGLEHAQKDQMNLICKDIAKDFYDKSLIMETYELFKDKHSKITVLPADIGLMVGIDSGKIYLGNNRSIPPDELKITVNEKGIIYS